MLLLIYRDEIVQLQERIRSLESSLHPTAAAAASSQASSSRSPSRSPERRHSVRHEKTCLTVPKLRSMQKLSLDETSSSSGVPLVTLPPQPPKSPTAKRLLVKSYSQASSPRPMFRRGPNLQNGNGSGNGTPYHRGSHHTSASSLTGEGIAAVQEALRASSSIQG